MKYEILEGASPSELMERVNAKTKQGWLPAGGVAVTRLDEGWCYTQAIIYNMGIPPR